MFIQFDHAVTPNNRIDIQEGAKSILITKPLTREEIQRAASHADTDDLIQELKDRGLTVLTPNDEDELAGDVAAGEALVDLITGLRGAIVAENHKLQNQLITALIFLATGEEMDLVFEDEVQAA